MVGLLAVVFLELLLLQQVSLGPLLKLQLLLLVQQGCLEQLAVLDLEPKQNLPLVLELPHPIVCLVSHRLNPLKQLPCLGNQQCKLHHQLVLDYLAQHPLEILWEPLGHLLVQLEQQSSLILQQEQIQWYDFTQKRL